MENGNADALSRAFEHVATMVIAEESTELERFKKLQREDPVFKHTIRIMESQKLLRMETSN